MSHYIAPIAALLGVLVWFVAVIALFQPAPPAATPTPTPAPTPIVHRVETPERVCYVVTYADTLLTLGCDPRGES